MTDSPNDATTVIDCTVTFADRAATIPGAAVLGFTRVPDGAEVHRVGPALLLTWDGALVPVLDLAAEAGLPPGDVGEGILVVVRQPAPDGPKALLVGAVGEPDGSIPAPVPAILAPYDGAALTEEVRGDETRDAEPELFLTVGAGGRTYLLPLGDVVRIEPYPEGGLQGCGNGLATVLSGRIVRTLPLFGCVPGGRPDQALVVTVLGAVHVALVVDTLGDVVEPSATPRLPWGRDGIVEARVVDGTALGVVHLQAVAAGPVPLRRAA